MLLFCDNSLQFTVVNNFDKKLHFQICYVVLNLSWVFFQIYIYYKSFFSPSSFKYSWNVNSAHTNDCLAGIPQQCLPCRLDVLVNFGHIFAFFLGTFIDFEYYLFITNATLWYIFVENKKGLYLWEELQNISFQQCQWLALWGVLQRYLSISCYDDVIFNFYYFILRTHA